MADVKSSESSVEGDLTHFNIFDVCQSLMMGRKTAQVSIHRDAKRAYIAFLEGQLVSALDDALQTGERAARSIFLWKTGRFRIDFDVCPRERNVNVDTQNLLLDVARQIDEARRDGEATTDGEIEEIARASEADRFSSELNRAFRQVAAQTNPARERWSVHAFDSLLRALTDLSGNALFLRPDSRPRVKTARGFATIKQEVVGRGEIDTFLENLLSVNERAILQRDKEITARFTSKSCGVFRVSAFDDGGRPALIFTPASKCIPRLAELGDAMALAPFLEPATGLVLVHGPLASGKSTLCASLIDHALIERDQLVALFSRTQTFDFPDDAGFLIRSDLSRFGLGAEGGLTGVVDQGADLIVVDEIGSAEVLRDALAIAARTSLVIASIEAGDAEELSTRLRAFIGADARQWRWLGQALLAAVEVDLGRPEGALLAARVPTVEERRRLTTGDVSVLRALAPTA